MSVARRITIREVARLADVSVGTVSNVLNGAANVSDATRRRVEQVVKELGFTPDVVARSLIARRRRRSTDSGLTARYIARAAADGLIAPDQTVIDLMSQILDDGARGATRHLDLAHRLLIHMADSLPKTELSWRTIDIAAHFIASTRGTDAPLVSNGIAWLMADVAVRPIAQRAAILTERAGRWQTLAAERLGRLADVVVAMLGANARPVLLDYSSTVAAIVERLHDRKLSPMPIVLESRGVAGGLRYANQFMARGIDLMLAPDMAIEHVLGQATAVLLGCESMRCDGSIVNALGSRPLARIARALNVPVYCCADLFKFDLRSYGGAFDLSADRMLDFPLLDEIAVPDGRTIDAAVPAVEIVPAEFLTAIVTEEGLLPPAALWGRGRTLFGDQRDASH